MASLPYPRHRHNPPTDSTDFHRWNLYKELPQNSRNSQKLLRRVWHSCHTHAFGIILPQIPRIFTDGTYTKNSHRIHRIHRSLGAFIAVWVWQECHTILYICVNPWNLWEFFSISTSVNSVKSVGAFSISTSVNSVKSVGVFSISTSVNSVGGLCRRRGYGKDAIPS